MKRKKSQILFNFLPDDTFNHAENGVIGKVEHIFRDRKADVDELPISYILRRIRPRVEHWPNNVPLRAGNVDLVSPDGVTFRVFPRVFECRECGACSEFSEGRLESGRSPFCGNCERRLTDTEQLQFVVVCPCGTIDSVRVPTCNRCSSKNPRFVRPTSRIRDAFWSCSDCGTRIGDAYTTIDYCNFCGKNKQLKVHSSSTTFYPQMAKFVNINDENLEFVTNNEQYQKDVIVDYISDESASSPEEIEVDPETLERLGVTEEEFKAAQKETAEESAQRRERLEEWVEKYFAGDERRQLSEELFEHQSLLDDDSIGGRTLEGLLDDIDTRPDLSEAALNEFLDRRDSLNFTGVRLIENFPITSVVYGYSRLNPGPSEDSELNTFRGDRMFTQTTQAEAVMFSLDVDQVVEWLLGNEVIDERPDEEYDRWFLRNLPDYPYFDEIDPEETSPIARHTLSLLHTYSHVVMYAMDALSGYSKSSLIEYVLPHTLSFAVYKHSDTDFSLGAMHTLVENRFTEIYDYIQDDADICMYDPVCETEENASCEGCLYVSTISCGHGNHNLSRSTLYGGEFDEGEIEGFLDV